MGYEMESAAGNGKSSPGQGAYALAGENEKENRLGEVQRDLSADPNTFPALPAQASPSPRPAQSPPPLWVRRLWLIIYVAFCVELGMLLIVLPWKSVWHTNILLADHPVLRTIFHNYFLRGLVTGLGIIDVWLGVSEAVHYREKKPPHVSDP
jgi:hypothetical protein